MPFMSTDTVAQLISKVANQYLTTPAQAQNPPQLHAALDAVLTLLERRVHADTDMGQAVAKARLACAALAPDAHRRNGDAAPE